MENQRLHTKYISILYRLTNRFYDHFLADYAIGSGQQFFLPHIHENEGISMYDLATTGHFDKGTVTKGIQKLAEQGYINIETDSEDKRIRRLYTTEKALSVIEAVYRCHQEWTSTLTSGMTEQETIQAEKLLQKMAENAYYHTCSSRAHSSKTD